MSHKYESNSLETSNFLVFSSTTFYRFRASKIRRGTSQKMTNFFKMTTRRCLIANSNHFWPFWHAQWSSVNTEFKSGQIKIGAATYCWTWNVHDRFSLENLIGQLKLTNESEVKYESKLKDMHNIKYVRNHSLKHLITHQITSSF